MEILTKLLTVKSIVTLVLTGVFAYLAAVGLVSADLFLTVYTVIISFYFGTQHERSKTAEATVLEVIPADQQEAEEK